MAKISKKKKFIKVFKRKLLKPILYAYFVSLLLYVVISSVVIIKKNINDTKPHFVITHISDNFDQTEYMHLLLTIQELNKDTTTQKMLKGYANMPFPSPCPKLLEEKLHQMNWTPQAFLVRIKKMFNMYNTYDRVARIEEAITLLNEEITAQRLPVEVYEHINALKSERQQILQNDITPKEYEFIKEYNGIVQTLQKI